MSHVIVKGRCSVLLKEKDGDGKNISRMLEKGEVLLLDQLHPNSARHYIASGAIEAHVPNIELLIKDDDGEVEGDKVPSAAVWNFDPEDLKDTKLADLKAMAEAHAQDLGAVVDTSAWKSAADAIKAMSAEFKPAQ